MSTAVGLDIDMEKEEISDVQNVELVVGTHMHGEEDE